MKLRSQPRCGRYVILFSIYAPTLQSDKETVMIFYKALRTAIVLTPNDKMIIFGDFDVSVGTDFEI